jgi:hypothetical protein
LARVDGSGIPSYVAGGFHLFERLLHSCGDGFLEILPLGADDARAIADFLGKYRDQTPDLADAALMRLA